MAIASTNPATGEVVKTFAELSDKEIDQKIAKAVAAFATHRKTPFSERALRMRRAGEILEAEKEAFGRLMTLEMGKTLKSAIAEAAKCATACHYYAENAEKFLADEVVNT